MTYSEYIKLLEDAVRAAGRIQTEALPKFNWGASPLDANAIKVLNEGGLKIAEAMHAIVAKNS